MERRPGRLETVPMIGHIVSWAKKFSWQFGRSNELQELEPDEIRRIARDFGVSVSDLLTLAKSDVHVQELLTQRLAEMGLSEKLLQDKHPREVGDLYRVCASCASTKQCTNDFLQHKSGHSEYCPNTETLEALRAIGDANAAPRVAGGKN
ncbi:DUF6455 family protein [Afipia sp. DC4300-2b1]|uniref:DUF6455 family protein n=1 Tax=Afipia sp. DC4300-2b1 TaxID=2804672 RepID=UPI003CF50DE5